MSTDIIISSLCNLLQGKGYTRGVTKPQFERLLHFQSLQVTPQELEVSACTIIWMIINFNILLIIYNTIASLAHCDQVPVPQRW